MQTELHVNEVTVYRVHSFLCLQYILQAKPLKLFTNFDRLHFPVLLLRVDELDTLTCTFFLSKVMFRVYSAWINDKKLEDYIECVWQSPVLIVKHIFCQHYSQQVTNKSFSLCWQTCVESLIRICCCYMREI